MPMSTGFKQLSLVSSNHRAETRRDDQAGILLQSLQVCPLVLGRPYSLHRRNFVRVSLFLLLLAASAGICLLLVRWFPIIALSISPYVSFSIPRGLLFALSKLIDWIPGVRSCVQQKKKFDHVIPLLEIINSYNSNCTHYIETLINQMPLKFVDTVPFLNHGTLEVLLRVRKPDRAFFSHSLYFGALLSYVLHGRKYVQVLAFIWSSQAVCL